MDRRIAVVLLTLTSGCAQLSDEMRTIETGYQEARYEDVIVWLDDIEHDVPHLEPAERARFYYLRGMSAHRLGQHDDALYYLALAREVAGEEGRGLRDPWKIQLRDTLAELTPEGATHHAREPAEQN